MRPIRRGVPFLSPRFELVQSPIAVTAGQRQEKARGEDFFQDRFEITVDEGFAGAGRGRQLTRTMRKETPYTPVMSAI